MNSAIDSVIFRTFKKYFDEENKEQAVLFILEKLQNHEIDVLDLYSSVLAPSLINLECSDDPDLCIWKEHIKTSIVRTILECCYPYIIKKQTEFGTKKRLKAVVLCPPEEYHDIGARMVSDYLTVCGCHSIYIGSNTPYKDFYHAIDSIHPDLIAISVSNYYNLVITKQIIEELKAAVTYPLCILVGGHAFKGDSHKFETVNADFYAQSFDDIKNIIDKLS